MPKMRDSRASQGVAESKGEEMKAETLEPLNHSPYISTVELKRLLAERERLLEACKSIRVLLNPDDEQSYRTDDSEGAMDTAFAKSESAIAFAEADESET